MRKLFFLLLVVSVSVWVLPVKAANIPVNTALLLIAAINTTNSNLEDDVITLTADITLTAANNNTDGDNGLPSILADSGNSLTIIGNGFTIERDAAAPQFRILHVSAGANLSLVNIRIETGISDFGAGIYNAGNLTVSNSSISSNSALSDGGAIYNAGSLTVNNSSFSSNSVLSDGGAIYNAGSLTVNNSSISSNSALSDGGAIYNTGTITVSNSSLSSNAALSNGAGIYNTGTIAVSNSSLSSNAALSNGAGIYNSGAATLNSSSLSTNIASSDGAGIYNAGTATLNNSSLSSNIASSNGAGIYNNNTATLNNSTLSSNTAAFDGSGIYNSGTTTLNNSTLSSNLAFNNGGGIYNGGTAMLSNSTLSENTAINNGAGIYNSGTATLNNSTLSENMAINNGGGIHNVDTITLNNSIVAGNTNVISSSECTLPSGAFNADANNIFGVNGSTGGCTGGTALAGTVDTLLEPLADYGGPTRTHALVGGSPAIDAAGACGLSSDQRGAARDAACDIGAYEAVLSFTLPTVEFAAASTSFYESEGTVSIPITVTGAVNFAGIATIIITDNFSGTATSASDYNAMGLQTVTIDCSSGTCPATVDVSLSVLTDALVEVDETLDLAISNANGMALIGSISSQETTIRDGAPPVPPVVPPSLGESRASPAISVFDPAISKLGLLVPGQLGVTGEELEWIVTVSNTGSVVGNNVVVTDTLNPALQIDSVNAPNASVNINGQTVTVTYASLNVGETQQFSIFTTVLNGAIVDNTACVNAVNQGAEECATALPISQLPSTGEAPLWREGLLALLGFGMLALLALKRKVKRGN